MDLYTWLSPISTREEFIALISLVEEGSLEELFIAQSLDAGVAGQKWKVGQILVFSFSASKDVEKRLQSISACINLDDVDERFFEEIDGVYILKSVFYPESDPQEEQIIAQLR